MLVSSNLYEFQKNRANCIFFGLSQRGKTSFCCYIAFVLCAVQAQAKEALQTKNHTDRKVPSKPNGSDVGPWNWSMMDLYSLFVVIYPLQLITHETKAACAHFRMLGPINRAVRCSLFRLHAVVHSFTTLYNWSFTASRSTQFHHIF